MNEFFRKLLSRLTGLWGKWSMVQRIISVAIVLVVIIGIIALFRVSAAPTMVSVIDAPIRDEAAMDRIILRINEEGVKVNVTSTGLIQVPDERTARRMRTILISEDLIPTGIDPWNIFDRERWTLTDFERKVNFQRAQTRMIIEHLKAINDIDDVKVTIVYPEKELLRSEQKPATASVTIIPQPGSDITTNIKKIEGVQKLLKYAVAGLTDEHITITDRSGVVLNDFSSLEPVTRLALIQKESKFISDLEDMYKKKVLVSLQQTFSVDRVRDLNIKINMDMSKKAIDTEEFFPITITPRDPTLPYDNSVVVESITRSRSSSDTNWEGTGYNPEGPAGVEGQTPPAFKDMSNLFGSMSQTTDTHNEEINRKVTQEEKSPQIERVTVSVNIDGISRWKYNDKGKPIVLADGTIERDYFPVPPEDLRAAQSLIRDAIGFNSARGDSVTVQNIRFDRTEQFRDEDAKYFREQQMKTTVLVFLSGLTILLVSFIIFRMISRELERRRRIAEDERSRREQAIRESAIAHAEEDGVDVSISVEERTRMELLESVLNMAREHPEDCAQLIRTWLLEE